MRSAVERPYAVFKENYGLRRMRFFNFARNQVLIVSDLLISLFSIGLECERELLSSVHPPVCYDGDEGQPLVEEVNSGRQRLSTGVSYDFYDSRGLSRLRLHYEQGAIPDIRCLGCFPWFYVQPTIAFASSRNHR